MLFVWSSNGGALQWVGLSLFLLQVVMPMFSKVELSMKAFPLAPILGAIAWCWWISWLTHDFRQNHLGGLSQGKFVVLLVAMLGVMTMLVYFFGAESLSSGLHLVAMIAFVGRAIKSTFMEGGFANNRGDDDDRQQHEVLSDMCENGGIHASGRICS
jgi:hypothetical protein